MSKLYSLIINIHIFLNIIWKGKGKRVNNGYHCYHKTVRFFWVFLLKNRPEPNKTGSVRVVLIKNIIFRFGCIFWLKPDRTGPWTPLLRTSSIIYFLINKKWRACFIISLFKSKATSYNSAPSVALSF